MPILKETRSLLDESVSSYHAIQLIKERLEKNNFVELDESKPFDLQKGGKYFYTRNASSIIAFSLPFGEANGFHIAASHSDSPTFKVKPNPIVTVGKETLLRVEPYGGMLMSTWLDRPLSIAGRIMVQNGNKIEQRLLYIDEDIAIIPNLCIHFNREANDGYKFNPDSDTIPLLGELGPDFSWNAYLKEKAKLKEEGEILDYDLFLTLRESSHLIGVNQQLLSSPRLDNLTSAYSSLLAFLDAKESCGIQVYVCFDNEEVGSNSRQGAASAFLLDALTRIARFYGKDKEELLASSFMLSIDNAHARHPNHPSTFEQSADVKLNGGIVLKYNANARYTSDAYSGSLVKALAAKAGVPVQLFSNRPDIRGGSTLGNISLGQVSIPSADIGLAQLAMHSSFETMGASDIDAMYRFVKEYFERDFTLNEKGITLH